MSVGDRVKAIVVQPLRNGGQLVVPQGATVSGHIVRIGKKTAPFPIDEIAIAFDTIELGGRAVPFSATMEEAGPSSGLLKQAKHLDPTFSTHRAKRIDILVREVQRGQGILEWDARHGSIPHGLRMKWRVRAEEP